MAYTSIWSKSPLVHICKYKTVTVSAQVAEMEERLEMGMAYGRDTCMVSTYHSITALEEQDNEDLAL